MDCTHQNKVTLLFGYRTPINLFWNLLLFNFVLYSNPEFDLMHLRAWTWHRRLDEARMKDHMKEEEEMQNSSSFNLHVQEQTGLMKLAQVSQKKPKTKMADMVHMIPKRKLSKQQMDKAD